MKKFATSLAERQRISRIQQKRYWSDSAYRLSCINRARVCQGLPPRASVDEIVPKPGRRA